MRFSAFLTAICLTCTAVVSCGNSNGSDNKEEGTTLGPMFPVDTNESGEVLTKAEDYRVPDLYGIQYKFAENTYSSIIFEVEVGDYTELDEGVIYEQDIEPDTPFQVGDTLKVKVSKGREPVDVPKLYNMELEAALSELEKCGLKSSLAYSHDSTVEAGKIVKTEPPEGQVVRKGDEIRLIISVGINEITVVDFIGMQIKDAELLAQYYLLTVKTEEVDSSEQKGKVIAQSIATGKEVPEGTEIILSYSNGKG